MKYQLGSSARRRASLTLLAAIMLAVSTARADAPPAFYSNGFETNTSGWLAPAGYGTLTRQTSGYTNSGGYADLIASATGTYHARLSGASCTLPDPCYGPFTYWGGYYQKFPINGYRTELNIYLDTAWASNHPDVRFDYVSSIGNQDGTFQRDFVFNAGTNLAGDPSAAGFYINATPNSFRANTYPQNTCPTPGASQPPNVCRTPVHITTSGWYTFKHRFYDDGTGHLAVNLQIFPLGNVVAVADWTIYSGDSMATLGGNRYGWLANEEIPDLPIDDSLRTGLILALAPATASNFVNTDHTVTATVTTDDTGGHPTFGPGEAVEFDVISGPNAGQTSHPSNTGICAPSNCTTDASGIVSWKYTSNGTPGTDTIQACFPDRPATDITGAPFKHAVGDEPRQCQTVTKVWTPACSDTTPPSVSLWSVLAGPPKTVVLKAQDAGGITNIVVIAQTNLASVKYSLSTTGSPTITFPHAPITAPVYIFAAKANQSAGSVIGVAVTDACGNVTNFDPVDVGVNAGGRREAVTITGVGGDENIVQIVNDNLRALIITVNDHVVEVGLTPNEVRFVDIGSALVPGDGNVVTLAGRGPHNASATVIIYPGTAPQSRLGNAFHDHRHGYSVQEVHD